MRCVTVDNNGEVLHCVTVGDNGAESTVLSAVRYRLSVLTDLIMHAALLCTPVLHDFH